MLYEVFRRSVGKKLTRLLALGVFSLTIKASALVFNLSDGNSVVSIDPASQAGLYSWVVDGQQQSFQQWFWYRIGAVGGESSINTIGGLSPSTPDARTLGITFANAQVNVQVIYSLLGGSVGSGNSDVSEQIRITNLGATPLDFHFFQYVDFDLLASPGGDSVQLGKNLGGKYNEAFQNDGISAFAETVTAPGANHGEANTFSNTLASLNDGNPTTLSDGNSAGPGDVTWALQWDVTIGAGSSFILSKDLNLTIPAIPEPTVFALISMGALCFAYRRSRR